MSLHIGGRAGDVAADVLMPGDPLRARWIAQTFLDDVSVYSEVRGMFGLTGTYRGRRVSVQGSGMGLPSISIYATELFAEYDARRVVRVGSCGALAPGVALGDLVLASGACTDSAINRLRFGGYDFAAVADFELLRAAADVAARTPDACSHVGLIFSSDAFYGSRPELTERLVGHGVLAVEMEANALYTVAAQFGRQALAICTVSDQLVSGEHLSVAERETGFGRMVQIALDTLTGEPS